MNKETQFKEYLYFSGKGIFIDMSCRKITTIQAGWFFPALPQIEDKEYIEYIHDISNLAKKWFPKGHKNI